MYLLTIDVQLQARDLSLLEDCIALPRNKYRKVEMHLWDLVDYQTERTRYKDENMLKRLILDINSPSEFPSLGAAPQPQHHSPVTWGNATRGNTHIFQAAGTATAQATSSHAPATFQTQPTHPHQQESIFSGSHFTGGLEDTRFGGAHNVIGQTSGALQPKTTSIEEFPPLGRSPTGEIGQDRRESLMHGGDSTEHPNGTVPGSNSKHQQTVQGRTDLLATAGGLLASTRHGGNVNGLMGPIGFETGSMASWLSPQGSMYRQHAHKSISPVKGKAYPLTRREMCAIQEIIGVGQLTKDCCQGSISSTQNGAQFPALGSLPHSTGHLESVDQQASRRMMVGGPSLNKQLDPSQLGLENDLLESPHSTKPLETLASMSPLDRYGLAGLLHMIRSENSDIGTLTVGQDLTALGLDLNQPDNRPLYQSFASPFAEMGAGSRLMEPDFYTPACYNVVNIRPLTERIPGFSDETLFYIFYSMPRDILQELAAVELTNRMWRYHKHLKVWLTKDNNFEPVRVSATEERGLYIFFDINSWQRQRRELVLRYDDLEDRIVSIAGSQSS
ncbi:MAG: hypothetical protein M1816_001485 [Peltula sp. TS41687]|nr:MAG: hypothetical protein M1816_001485 [Peltula sp. TS41687]